MADTILLLETARDAIDFADGMVDDQLWTSGRGKAREARFARVLTLLALAETLRLEIVGRETAGKPTAHVEQLVSEIAIELSELARRAIGDKVLKPLHFDPWVLTHVVEEDAWRRERRAPPVLALVA